MRSTRRTVLKMSAAAAAGLALGVAPPTASGRPRPAKGLKILILGGTGFLGPAVLEAARTNGHTVTLFNRGRTERRKPGQFDEVEKLYGNRDPKLRADDTDPRSPQGLAALEGDREWDAVVDTSGYVPRIVKASTELLRDRVKHYTFISTISVYARNDTPGADESAGLATMDDPTGENVQAHYGALKALCERAAEELMPGRVANIRPGFIVGPGDPTDRFTYWPVRASRGGTMLAPGDPAWPVQCIDVRDLAAFIIACIERNTTGMFNATGPGEPLGFGAFVDACAGAAKALGHTAATPEWVSLEFLRQQGVSPGGDLPVWVPPVGEMAGFHKVSIGKALAAGLAFRPIGDTCRDTLGWWPTEVDRRARVTKQMQEDAVREGKTPPTMPDPTKPRAGMTPERESELLKLWERREKQ
jgi:2'-hydroxyisoflavone reductase